MLIAIGLLTFITWLTYGYCIRNSGFVSDDIEGLQNWDGKVKQPNYGFINKWILLKLFGKRSDTNHFFSILVHNANVILLFLFLQSFSNPTVALYASILFAVHPIGTQAVAWISGRGYPIGLFFTLFLLNTATIYAPQVLNLASAVSVGSYVGFGVLVSVLYYLSVNAQFACLATFLILAFMGQYLLSAVGLALSLLCGMGIIREVINLRKGTFKEQNLGNSTYLKPQKVIVALKSLAYYTYLCLFPKRLGLYHTFFYHYSEKTEQEDRWFWMGLVLALGALGGAIWGSNIVRLGILWYIAYLVIFLNWITIHQFVSERYVYIPNIGLCILLAIILQNYPILLAILATAYMVRTWVNLPSYKDEVMFYQSNIWNFPNSEVAFANLGVVYMRCQLVGSALEMWQISANINPDYDVAHYNIHSILKSRGDLLNAKTSLEKALKAKCCHFKDQWTKELEELNREIGFLAEANEIRKQLTGFEKDPAKKDKATELRSRLDAIGGIQKALEEQRQKNIQLIQQDESLLTAKMTQVRVAKDTFSKPITGEQFLKVRTQNMDIIKQGLSQLVEVKNAQTNGGIQKG